MKTRRTETIFKQSRELEDRWWSNLVEKLERMAVNNETNGLYNSFKQIYGPRSNLKTHMKSEDGSKLLAERDDIIGRWREHFSTLLNENANADYSVINRLNQRPIKHELDIPITMVELENALKSMRRGKAPRLDGIPAEKR